MNYYMTLVERDNYRIKKMLDKSEKMKKINKMIKSEKSQNGTKCGDLVASLDYVHDYRFIIHIAKQLAKKQLSPIHFFHLIHSFNTGK